MECYWQIIRTFILFSELHMFMKCFSLLLFGFLLSFNSFAIGPITGITHVCSGSTTALSDATSGGTWGSSNTAIATVNATGVVSGVSFGTSVITYTAGAYYVLATVTVNAAPVVHTVTGGGSYCAGDSGVHIYLSGSQLGVNYLLEDGSLVGGPLAGTGSSLDFGLQTAVGAYIVVATITATGCSADMSGSATVTISPTVPVSLSILASPGDTVCAGTSTVFTALPFGEGVSPVYKWTVNGIVVGGDSSTYTYVPDNGDIVDMTLVSSAACAVPDTVTASDTMTVFTRVVPAVAISATPGTEVCRATVVLLTAVPVYGGPAPSYTWVKNGVVAGTGSGYTFTPVNGDTIHCTMVSDYACLLTDTVRSSETTMVVDTPLNVYLSITSSPGTHILPGEFDTLIAVVINGGTSPTFVWWLNGLETTDTTYQYISNTFSAPYPDSITCVVTSGNACRSSTFSWVYIVVSDLGVTSTPLSEETLNVFPNPNNGEFTVQGSIGGEQDAAVSLELTDVLGRVVYKTATMANDGQINARLMLNGSLPRGMYLLNLRSDAENKVFRILIRE
jgi:hypothetical protein